MTLPPRKLRMPARAPVQTTASPAAKTGGLRPPVKSAPTAPAAPSGPEDGFARARRLKAEADRQAELRRNRPNDFYMKPAEKGADGQDGVPLVILDNIKMPQNPHFHYMHRWGFQKGVANSAKEEICLQDDPSGCPLCDKLGQKGRWELNLSVIDGRPYTPRSGPNQGRTIPRSKKLLTAKTRMIPKFERLYKEHKRFRGMLVRMFRDNDKDDSIGSEIRFVRFLTEQELAKYGELAVPIDYKKAFPVPTADDLRKRYEITGGNAVGSDDIGGATGDDSLPF